MFNGRVIADTRSALRVLETSHPPTYYVPPSDVALGCIVPTDGASLCEWKGEAVYHAVVVGSRRAERAAWSYPSPTAGFVVLKDHLAFYPGLVDACYVGGELARAQPGGFYGGWITSAVVGPFKGEPGTELW